MCNAVEPAVYPRSDDPDRRGVKNAGVVFSFSRSNSIAYLRHAFIFCDRFCQHIIPKGMKSNVPAGQNAGGKCVSQIHRHAAGTQYGTGRPYPLFFTSRLTGYHLSL
jgi:hypothetical protein